MARTALISIHLIRSGPTTWQENLRLQGRADLPLSGNGLAEVSAAASAWSVPAEARWVFCAPDEASRQTAHLFVQRLPGGKLKAVEDLREVAMGLWEGQTAKLLNDRYPKAYGQWLDCPESVSVPEGEPSPAALQRLLGAILKLTRKPAHRPLILVVRPIAFDLLCRHARALYDDSRACTFAAWETHAAQLQSAIDALQDDHRRISA